MSWGSSTRRSPRWAVWWSACWRKASTRWKSAIPKLAEATAASDRDIDLIERDIQELTILMIAKRQPLANDLRHVMTVLKIAGDLERIGDLGKNIAKRALAVSGESHPSP